MLSMLRKYLLIFFMSMIPVFELRGSIICGGGMDLPIINTYIVSVIGNILPVPFILLFIRAILRWMKKVSYLQKIALWVEKIAQRKTSKMMNLELLGLFLFVAIPLPGTGAWMGSLIAAMLDIRIKYALPVIFAGVAVAGLIMSGVVYGFIGFLDFLL